MRDTPPKRARLPLPALSVAALAWAALAAPPSFGENSSGPSQNAASIHGTILQPGNYLDLQLQQKAIRNDKPWVTVAFTANGKAIEMTGPDQGRSQGGAAAPALFPPAVDPEAALRTDPQLLAEKDPKASAQRKGAATLKPKEQLDAIESSKPGLIDGKKRSGEGSKPSGQAPRS